MCGRNWGYCYSRKSLCGLGSAVAEYLGENDPTVVERIGVRDEFGEVGSEEYLRGRFGFIPEKIAKRVKEAIAKKKA